MKKLIGLDNFLGRLNRGEKSNAKEAIELVLKKLESGPSYVSTEFSCGWAYPSEWLVEGWKYSSGRIAVRITKHQGYAIRGIIDEATELWTD